MKKGESRNVITFPGDDVRAVEVPLEKMQVRLDDGIIDFPNNENLDPIELPDELDTAMQAARSMIVIVDVDSSLEDVYSESVPIQADVHHLEDLPEQERFKIDPTHDAENIYPKTCQLYLAMYNTRNLPEISQLRNRGSYDHTETIDSTEWTTVVCRPGFSYDKERLKYKNTGSNDLEYRIQTIDAGMIHTEELNNAGETNLTLAPGESDSFYVDTATEFIRIQAKETTSGNPSDLKAVLTGE